jgi:PAS domain S-box-containing protein
MDGGTSGNRKPGRISVYEERRPPTNLLSARDDAVLGPLEAVIEAMGVGLIVLDARHQFRVFNREAFRIMGVVPDGSPSEGWSARFGIYLPDRKTLFPTEALPLLRGLRGERGNVEAYVRPPGAREGTWVNCTFSPVRDPAGRVAAAVAVFRDVTREVEARQAQAESEHQLERAQRVGHVGSWEWDLVEDRITWSDEHYRLLGLEPGAITPTYAAFLAMVHPDDRAIFRHAIDQALRGEPPPESECRVILPDGRVRVLRAQGEVACEGGRPIRYTGVTSDVTETRRITRALEESEVRLRAIIENTTDSIYIRDLEGRYLLANRVAAEVIAGVPIGELIGKRDVDVFDAETARRIRETDARVLAWGAPETFEIVTRSRSGHSGVYLTTKFPYRSPTGELLGVIGIARDITVRKRLEETLRAQYERISELDRMKTDLVNAVSHDLRSPLTAIMGYAELLEDALGEGQVAEPEALCDHLAQIEKNAQRLEGMVEDLLDFARLESGTFALDCEEADFRRPVTEMLESFRPQAQAAGVALRAELPAQPLPVRLDDARVQRVLANLIGNALKFTPAGGEIRVRAGLEDGALRCVVADTGVGIAAEDLPRLFHRFTQLEAGRRAHGGLGLGLWICKALVEAHGGRIGVESAPGKGSSFWFTLPRGEPEV